MPPTGLEQRVTSLEDWVVAHTPIPVLIPPDSGLLADLRLSERLIAGSILGDRSMFSREGRIILSAIDKSTAYLNLLTGTSPLIPPAPPLPMDPWGLHTMLVSLRMKEMFLVNALLGTGPFDSEVVTLRASRIEIEPYVQFLRDAVRR